MLSCVYINLFYLDGVNSHDGTISFMYVLSKQCFYYVSDMLLDARLMFMITVLGLCVLSVLVLNCMFELSASFGQEGLAGGIFN